MLKKIVILYLILIPSSIFSNFTEYFEPKIKEIENFKLDRDFKKFAIEVNNLRLSYKANRATENIFSELIDKIVKQINESSDFPISKIALAKALLTKAEFDNYANNNINWQKANETWSNFINNPYTSSDYIKIAIKKDGNLDLRLDSEGNTALILASKQGKLDIVEILIKAGANLDLQNNNGETALIAAADIGQPYIIDLLAKAGASLNLQDINGNTALMRDIEKTGFCTLTLIRLGANVNIKNDNGDTALMLSIFKPWFIEPLIKARVNIDATNNEGDTALIKASCNTTNTEDISNTSMTAALLITNWADLDIQNKLGNTALMTAIINSRDFIARRLIEEDADLNKQNNNGDTALSLAVNIDNNEIITLLIEKKAEL